ncbi:MAG: hypothetical protein DRQ78_01740 [Epsilonproteobacteria bacterium]|nr:MAG: hypothetical protein DRQ78_01740 [Campylobacterota bacterium]
MRSLKRYVHVYPLTWALLVVHIFFIVIDYKVFSKLYSNPFLAFGIGILTIIMQVQLIKILSFSNQRISTILTVLLLVIYTILYTFYYYQHIPLDYALLYSNFDLIFYKESLQSIFSILSFTYLLYFVFIVILIYFLNKKYFFISSIPSKSQLNKKIIFLTILINILLINAPSESTNNIFKFIQSMKYFYKAKKEIILLDTNKYPYMNINKISHIFEKTDDKPHVFILFMESFNGLFVGAKAKNGKEVTPYFNQLKEKGLYVNNFYGHSIQTAKGQFATFSGVFPSVYSKVFTTYGNLNLYGLPSVLNDYGYTTVFTKAYKSLSFDNTRNYAEKLGFKYIDSMGEKKYLNKKDKEYIWGWGLQDDIYYQKFFKYLDNIHDKDQTKPIFASLTTVSNHMMFNKIPKNQKYLYPQAKTNYTNFINSMYLADKYLMTFFEELKKRNYLKNSIIIVTGDHSWPSGNHGYWHNETSFYEEFFKTPFLILWNGKIKPTTNFITSSQIDIAPTILDMLNIKTKNHFIGKSIFTKKTEESILLVQPYNGTFIIAQKEKIKYVKHLKDEKEYLFDLNSDPKELENILDNIKHKNILGVLKRDVQKLLYNNELIKQNRIFPPNKDKYKTIKRRNKIKHHFTLKVKQQYKNIRHIDAKHFDTNIKTFYIDTIDFLNAKEFIHRSLGKLNYYSNFFTEIEGLFNVKIAGDYDIKIASDDGYRLFIDGKKVSEFKTGRPMKSNIYKIYLAKGMHNIKLYHYQGYGKVGLNISYKFVLEKKYKIFGINSKEIFFDNF